MDKSLKTSPELMCCRGCLATDVNLFDIHENQLAKAFGCITGLPVLLNDGFPQRLCGVCGILLAKSVAFRDRCQRTQHCLQKQDEDKRTMDYVETVDRLSHNLVFKLAITQVEVMDISTSPIEVKDELSIVVKETIFKDENDLFGIDIDEHSLSPLDNVAETLDDDDDEKTDEVVEIGKKIKIEQVLIPTDNVKVKKRQTRKRNVVVKNKKKELKKRRIFGPSPTEYQPNFDVAELEKELNVDIEILDKEQQLEHWRQFSARKKKPAAFSCQECGKGFDQPTTYNNHLLRHSPNAGRFACEVCRVRFRRRSELRLHRHRHALRFTCRECNFVTRDKNQAKLHFSAHGGHLYQCKHCEKTFVKRSSYLSHVRLVHAAQNVSCGECGETFVSQLGLTQHYTKTHKAQKAASKCVCASCGAAFDNAEALEAHTQTSCDPAARPCAACGASLPSDEALRTHTEECHKEFKCTECPLTFASDGPRDTHFWRVHRELRPGRSLDPRSLARCSSRVCPVCGRQCQNPYILEEHMRIHTGEKPYACADCSLRFSCRANQQRHHKVVHLGQRPMVKCGECGKRLGAASLTTHVKYVHRKLPQKPRQRKPQPTAAT